VDRACGDRGDRKVDGLLLAGAAAAQTAVQGDVAAARERLDGLQRDLWVEVGWPVAPLWSV
jgi:hypothetical protein